MIGRGGSSFCFPVDRRVAECSGRIFAHASTFVPSQVDKETIFRSERLATDASVHLYRWKKAVGNRKRGSAKQKLYSRRKDRVLTLHLP
eukprot:1196196-Pleurochrysis_carterae.AAC.2